MPRVWMHCIIIIDGFGAVYILIFYVVSMLTLGYFAVRE